MPSGAPTHDSPPFFAPGLKLRRASRHLAELEREIARFQQTVADFKPMPAIIVEFEGKVSISQQIVIHSPPEDVGAIVGDVIHNLRSALDLMACDLVRKGGGNPNQVYFPFCETPEDLPKVLKRRNFHRAGEKAIALLEELKPYRGGNVALRAIHDLDVQDKHKALIPVCINTSGEWVSFEVGEDLKSVQLLNPPADEAGQHVDVVFPSDHPFGGQEIVPTLRELVKLTASVLDGFAALDKEG